MRRTCFCLPVLLATAFLLLGCVRSYPVSPIHPEERATLAFTTETLGQWYWYVQRRLSLAVYEMEPTDDPDRLRRKEYLGTIRITKEENTKTVVIPSGTALELAVEYYQATPVVDTSCTPPPRLLRAKRGASYILRYTREEGRCWVSITRAPTEESLEVQPSMSPGGGRTRSEEPPRASGSGADEADEGDGHRGLRSGPTR